VEILEIKNLLTSDNINILAISHLDNSFDVTAVAVQGYNISRRHRNAYERSVAIYIYSEPYPCNT
jgi:hypothetical protein